jgi:hypothetical protein
MCQEGYFLEVALLHFLHADGMRSTASFQSAW